MHPIGIRREDKSRWERRVPLTPLQIGQLTGQGVEVHVQPSPIRVFTDAEYQHAGARIHESLAPCPLVFGVKEIPLDFFEPGKTYVFFSHTHKGQTYNMPMLARILELGCSLIDYELITDEEGRRLIFFGRFAGLAGMLDTLWALGRRLEAEGTRTPFSAIRRAWEYDSLEEAREQVAACGREISREGLPAALTPLICGFAGYGRVSLGAQEIYDLLPVRELDPEELAEFRRSGEASPHFVYKAVFHEEHMYRRLDGAPFDFNRFVAAPEEHAASFERLASQIDVLLHGIYWEDRFPELISREFLRRSWSDGKRPRLRVVGDVTCDIRGSIACTVRPADTDHPTYIYHPETDETSLSFDGPGPLVLAVDNLPCELPRDSSAEFGAGLAPFVARMARAATPDGLAIDRLPPEIRRAVIAHEGRLTAAHEDLARLLPERGDRG